MNLRFALPLVASLALFAPAALAQGTDPAAADALFQKGREAAEKGDWAGACPKFAESQRLDPAPGTLLNLADCEEHLGQLAYAYEHFKTALETMPGNDDRIQYTKQRMAGIEKQVPHLTLVAAPDMPTDAKVTRDDVQLGSASMGLALPVNPGPHTIKVTAPGHKEKSTTITVKAGESQSFTVSAGDVDTSPAPAAALPSAPSVPSFAAATPSHASKKTLGYVAGGVGLAALGVGAVTGIMVLGKKSTVTDPAHCDQTTFACDAAGVQAASDGKSLATISTVAFVGGALLTGVGAYLVITSKDDTNGGSATMVGPTTVAGGAGMRLVHTF